MLIKIQVLWNITLCNSVNWTPNPSAKAFWDAQNLKSEKPGTDCVVNVAAPFIHTAWKSIIWSSGLSGASHHHEEWQYQGWDTRASFLSSFSQSVQRAAAEFTVSPLGMKLDLSKSFFFPASPKSNQLVTCTWCFAKSFHGPLSRLDKCFTEVVTMMHVQLCVSSVTAAVCTYLYCDMFYILVINRICGMKINSVLFYSILSLTVSPAYMFTSYIRSTKFTSQFKALT